MEVWCWMIATSTNASTLTSSRALALCPLSPRTVSHCSRVCWRGGSASRLHLVPRCAGEFVVMNYRVTGDFRAPFRIFPIVEETSPHKVELLLKIRADIPENNYGANVTIRFPVPRNAATVHPELSAAAAVTSGPRAGAAGAGGAGAGGTAGQAAEYRAKDRQVIWQIKKFMGGTEHTLRTRITLSAPSTSSVRKEMGPIGYVAWLAADVIAPQ